MTEGVIPEQPDLLVWPESAYEGNQSPGGDAFLSAIANGSDTPLLTGAWRVSHRGAELRNAALLVERGGKLVGSRSRSDRPLPRRRDPFSRRSVRAASSAQLDQPRCVLHSRPGRSGAVPGPT
jgi:hypothetical protein